MCDDEPKKQDQAAPDEHKEAPARLVLNCAMAARKEAGETIATFERDARRAGPVSCTAGCAACCREAVLVTAWESAAIAGYLGDMMIGNGLVSKRPWLDQLFTKIEAAAKEERITLERLVAPSIVVAGQEPKPRPYVDAIVDFIAQWSRPCPFLTAHETCGIYSVRPIACAMRLVRSPASDCDGAAKAIRYLEMCDATDVYKRSAVIEEMFVREVVGLKDEPIAPPLPMALAVASALGLITMAVRQEIDAAIEDSRDGADPTTTN